MSERSRKAKGRTGPSMFQAGPIAPAPNRPILLLNFAISLRKIISLGLSGRKYEARLLWLAY